MQHYSSTILPTFVEHQCIYLQLIDMKKKKIADPSPLQQNDMPIIHYPEYIILLHNF